MVLQQNIGKITQVRLSSDYFDSNFQNIGLQILIGQVAYICWSSQKISETVWQFKDSDMPAICNQNERIYLSLLIAQENCLKIHGACSFDPARISICYQRELKLVMVYEYLVIGQLYIQIQNQNLRSQRIERHFCIQNLQINWKRRNAIIGQKYVVEVKIDNKRSSVAKKFKIFNNTVEWRDFCLITDISFSSTVTFMIRKASSRIVMGKITISYLNLVYGKQSCMELNFTNNKQITFANMKVSYLINNTFLKNKTQVSNMLEQIKKTKKKIVNSQKKQKLSLANKLIMKIISPEQMIQSSQLRRSVLTTKQALNQQQQFRIQAKQNSIDQQNRCSYLQKYIKKQFDHIRQVSRQNMNYFRHIISQKSIQQNISSLNYSQIDQSNLIDYEIAQSRQQSVYQTIKSRLSQSRKRMKQYNQKFFKHSLFRNLAQTVDEFNNEQLDQGNQLASYVISANKGYLFNRKTMLRQQNYSSQLQQFNSQKDKLSIIYQFSTSSARSFSPEKDSQDIKLTTVKQNVMPQYFVGNQDKQQQQCEHKVTQVFSCTAQHVENVKQLENCKLLRTFMLKKNKQNKGLSNRDLARKSRDFQRISALMFNPKRANKKSQFNSLITQ